MTKPQYYHSILGASIQDLTAGKLKNAVEQRIISGNVLTGTRVVPEGHLGYYDNQITVIPEGNNYEFYTLDTNYHGERRAFVVTGQYEKVFPMDIYPVYLLKAVLAQDIDRMEQLGIYEVVPEDMALCEFVCTSKTPVQKILSDGIELMMKETN